MANRALYNFTASPHFELRLVEVGGDKTPQLERFFGPGWCTEDEPEEAAWQRVPATAFLYDILRELATLATTAAQDHADCEAARATRDASIRRTLEAERQLLIAQRSKRALESELKTCRELGDEHRRVIREQRDCIADLEAQLANEAARADRNDRAANGLGSRIPELVGEATSWRKKLEAERDYAGRLATELIEMSGELTEARGRVRILEADATKAAAEMSAALTEVEWQRSRADGLAGIIKGQFAAIAEAVDIARGATARANAAEDAAAGFVVPTAECANGDPRRFVSFASVDRHWSAVAADGTAWERQPGDAWAMVPPLPPIEPEQAAEASRQEAKRLHGWRSGPECARCGRDFKYERANDECGGGTEPPSFAADVPGRMLPDDLIEALRQVVTDYSVRIPAHGETLCPRCGVWSASTPGGLCAKCDAETVSPEECGDA